MRCDAKYAVLIILMGFGWGGLTHASEETHWAYEGEAGPSHWAEMSPDFARCESGSMQSPIDLNTANAVGDVPVKVSYKPATVTVHNNGHTIQANFPRGLKLQPSGKDYHLIQVHFHTPSEHAMDGHRFPMVAHFVHASEAGELAVLGIMIDEGKSNPELGKIAKAVDGKAVRQETQVALNANDILPEGLQVYRYMGSLTTPPCSEGVNWLVANNPARASRDQIESFAKMMGSNARPMQERNNRLVVKPQ